MATNDSNYKITDINVTAAVIGKPLTINGTALYSNTDGYYGPYAYKATQDNAGKKRFKEVVFDPTTFEDVEIWHPISAGDGISGTIQIDPDDNTKYVFKTKMDYALNLALFLIGDKRGDGFTFAVEDDDGVLVEYILHRDQNNNPTVERKVDPQQILNSVREDVIAIATANSLKLNTVLAAVSSNITDGTIQLPMSKLTDDQGNPVDLNSMFMLSTDATNFVAESQATNFILTDDFRNLLATNLGVSTASASIGDEFFREQLNNNPNFSNIIQSNINDQLANNTNLGEMIKNVVTTNEALVRTNYLVNLATTNDLVDLVNTATLTAYAKTNDIFTGGKIKDELFGNNVLTTNNTNYFSGGVLRSDRVNLPNDVVRSNDQVFSGLVYTSNTAFVTNAVTSNLVASKLPNDVLRTSDTTYFTNGVIKSDKILLPSGVVMDTDSVLQNIVYASNTAFVTNAVTSNLVASNLPEDVLRTTNTNYFVDGNFAVAKMPDTIITTSTVGSEMSNNASVILDEIADIRLDDFDDLLVDTPIDNSLENLLDVVKDVEIPEIALRTVMSNYNGYAYCTITNTTNESTRLTSWNSVSENDRKSVILEVDAVNASNGEDDPDPKTNNYVYLLPNNTLKSGMITDQYIPCDDPVGHKIDIYKKNSNGTYSKYTGTVTDQDTTPYYYKATDAIFVVFECYWVKKDGSTRTCYKLPFNHTITVGTQYLDGTKYKELGTVAEVIQHIGDPTYVSVTKHYLNDSDTDHTGEVEVDGNPYNYYLALDNSSEPMFSGMSKTYLIQYTNMYKLKIVQQFHDGNTTTDILTSDISGDGCADMNEAICELCDRATGNSVVDMYTPYDVEYYYVAKKNYNAETPNAAALELIENTIEYFEADEPDTNYVYLFCYKDAPYMVQYGGENINCYALYFRAYARISDKVTALNWKPVIPYSIESKQFVYPAIIDLTGYGETYPVPVSKNFNTNYPIYMNDFVQVYMNTYNNLDNLFIEDGRAMKKVNSWQQNGNVPHFRRVIGERTTTMTGDEKVDYFLYHKKTLVTEVPDKVIPESLAYNVTVGGLGSLSLKMTGTTTLNTLDSNSYNAYDGIRARAVALAYMLDDSSSQLDVSASRSTLKLYEVMAAASMLGKYDHIDWGPSGEFILKTNDSNDTNRKILFYELSIPGTSDTGYYVAPGSYGYTILNDIFKPLGLLDKFGADADYPSLYSFKLAEPFKYLFKIFEWANMQWSSPIAGDQLGAVKFYYALYYAYNSMLVDNVLGYLDIIVDYYNGDYVYGSGSRSNEGLPLLDYFYAINVMAGFKLGGTSVANDIETLMARKLSDAYSGTVPTLSDVKGYYVDSLCNSEWFNNPECNDNFQNVTKVGDYRVRYQAQVTIPQDPIVSTDRQAREFGLVNGTTTKGFYATVNQNYTASSVYAPYTRTSEPSDWATADYYTKSGNTYTKYTGAWDAGTTYYYKIPNHVSSLFSRNAIVRFLVGSELLDGGKQRSVIEIRKWNRFTKNWSDLGIEQSVHTAVSDGTTDVPSYPTTGHEIAQVNDRNFELYNEVIDEIRVEADGNSTLLANKINQLVNVVNGLVFANLATATNQNFVEFANEYTGSLVTPLNYSPTEGAIYEGTAADIPTPPQYVRHVDVSGVAPSTNNVVATNENIEIERATSQVGWETTVPRGRVKNL